MRLEWLGACFLSLAVSLGARADDIETIKPRDNAWSIGFHARQLHLGEASDKRLRILSSAIEISRVWIKPTWWLSLDAALIVGPNGTRFTESPPIDFAGTGFSLRWAMPLLADGLRQPQGDWGLGLGAELYQLIGRSYQRETLPDGATSSSWVIRSRWNALVPSVFYSRLAPARPKGYKPEWLMTRIEGYTLHLGLAVPVQSTLRIDSTRNDVVRSRSSDAKGYMVIASLAAWLGI
jgi:hypothetical protein